MAECPHADAVTGSPPVGAIVALAGSSFTYVTAETLPVGLLPQIASGLSVGEAQTGLLLTTYALVVAVSTIPLTALTLRVNRKHLLVVTVAILAVSQLLSAVAPSFLFLVLARVVCALAHGVFWAALIPAAATLVRPEQLARVTSQVFLGNTAALALGLPAATLFGQSFGWRAASVLMAVLGTLSAALIIVFVPSVGQGRLERAHAALHVQILRTFGVLRSGVVTMVCIVAIATVAGQFIAYTYFTPLVERGTVLGNGWTGIYLLVYGVSGIMGNVFIGPLADRRPGPSLSGSVSLIILAYLTFALVGGPIPIAIAVFAWGLGFPAATVALQAAVLRADPSAQDAASAIYVVAFQLGISAGSLVGERVVTGSGLTALPTVGGAVLIFAVVSVLVSTRVFPPRLPYDAE